MVQQPSATGRIVQAELQRGLKGLLGGDVPAAGSVQSAGALLVGTPASSPSIAGLGWQPRLKALGDEGYVIRSATVGGHRTIVIASQGEIGTLYGAFHFLRLIQTRQPIAAVDLEQRPRLERRLLNHWDNLNGSIERGYAGASLWRWDELPDRVDPRIEDYARANASIGINGSVVNNVNANPEALTPRYLEKIAAIARVLRPYGIRVYMSANLAAPRMIGKLPSADPLDPAVARWWRERTAEIYQHIPDFGGFVVKANSEGQPGPQDYGRTHADGANVLADALAPHGGIVMWRAFVYNPEVDPDRVKRAYLEFVPLDGRFRENVFVQVKNGPLDFQPREPFHPIFGAMPRTPLMAELQITQEYLGHSTHLVYLAPMWKEFLDADTYAKGPGSSVARVIDGTLEGHQRTGIAGVANTGRDGNWTGHHFGQANWYAYGRLAWDPGLEADAIAEEWIAMTWGGTPEVVATIRSMMLDSREAFVNYTMPLGLHHLIGGDHYAPMPENPDPRRADWSAIYYHRADTGRNWIRSHAEGERRRPSIPRAARARSGAIPRRSRRSSSSGSIGCHGTTGCDRDARSGTSSSSGTRWEWKKRAGCRHDGSSFTGAWTTSVTRRCWPGCTSRSRMPSRGATSACATSSSSARDRSSQLGQLPAPSFPLPASTLPAAGLKACATYVTTASNPASG